MTKQVPIKNNKKTQHLSSKMDAEDFELLNQTVAEKSLFSRKEALHVWANSYRGLSDIEKNDCKYSFGDFCLNTYGKNPEKLKKTSVPYCQACLNVQESRKRRHRS